MRNAVTVLVVLVIGIFLTMPVILVCSEGSNSFPDGRSDGIPNQLISSIESSVIPAMNDTSDHVTEYPQIARALLLPGGSTDSILTDLNNDSRLDLIVAVADPMQLSVFIRAADDTLPSSPSANTMLDGIPIALAAASVLADNNTQVLALIARLNDFDTERLVVLNFTSENLPLNEFFDTDVYKTAQSFVVGRLNADIFPDIAFACPGLDPENSPGVVDVRMGPYYSLPIILNAGRGSKSIILGNFSGDTSSDLAVGDYQNQSISVFYQPLANGNDPSKTLSVDGAPVEIVSGRLNSDNLDDIVAATIDTPALRFYFQSSIGGLPEEEYANRTIDLEPSNLDSGDLNGDGLTDLLVLSESESRLSCFYQSSAPPTWQYSPDFTIPTGSYPRNALVGNLDADASADLAIATARADWSGASIAIYPARSPHVSNSNATVWADDFSYSAAVEAADIDGDGVDDLVWLHPLTNAFGYKLGSEAGGFPGYENLKLLGYLPRQMMLSDVGNDMRTDILLSKNDGPEITLYSWNSSSPGSFDKTSSACLGNVTWFADGSFNNDAFLDIVAVTRNGTVEIFYGDTSSGFLPPVASLVISSLAVTNWTIVAGDFNSDGLDDIAYPSPGCKIAVHYQRTGEPRFESLPDTVLFSSGSDFDRLWSGDLTGDGRADISAMRPGDPAMYLFDQVDFSTSFGPYGTLVFPEVPRFVTVVDATDDWCADVLAIFESADLLFLYKQENGTIPTSPSMVFVTGGEPNYASIGDATQDHRGDLIVNEAASHSVSVWRQVNYPPPVAHIGGPYVARQGDPLELAGWTTTGRSELPYMEYNWSFGDGISSGWIRDPTPAHVYYAVGVFAVNLTVRDPWGMTDGNSTSVEVLDSLPHPDFSWAPSYPHEGDWVVLTDSSSSYDPIVRVNWSIDGIVVLSGTPANASSLSWQFQNGSHQVVLELADNDGSINDTHRIIDILPVAPVVGLSSQASAMEGETVVFTASVDEWNGGPWDEISLVEWDFSYDQVNFVPEEATGTELNTSHQFPASGYSENFTVAVRVTDSDGNTSIAWTAIEVFDIGPASSFVIVSDTPEEGVEFYFEAHPHTWDGIVSGQWTLEAPGGSVTTYPLAGSRLNATLEDGSYTMTLTVSEADGDNDSWSYEFNVREVAPQSALDAAPSGAGFEEFSDITFTAVASSYDPIVSYEWDFDTIGSFEGDLVTAVNTVVYSYVDVGDYIPEVKVTDEDGSWSIAFVGLSIVQDQLSGDFDADVTVTRDDEQTNLITFVSAALANRYHDIVETTWSFGDGASVTLPGPPSTAVTHEYSPTEDYTVRLTITDDDQYSLVLNKTLKLRAPTIGLSELPDEAVIHSGTPVQFIIGQGSTPLVSVNYSINGGQPSDFAVLYNIDTSGWTDGPYALVVKARDEAGNVAVKSDVLVIIDDVAPVVSAVSVSASVYGGDKLNVSFEVDDPNIGPGDVILYVKFPGDNAFSSFTMTPVGNGTYYRLLEVPTRDGRLQYYANATDLAGNSVVTETYHLDVHLRFMDYAWPYLLTLAVLAALGTGVYFLREAKIAVDETFVIYSDGRLISHSTRRLKPGMDDQVLGGMFVAIQDFVKDSFKDVTSFTLRKIEFGEKSVLIEKGSYLYLAVILHGKASRKVAVKMQRIVDEMEEVYSDVLAGWDGDLDALRGVGDIAKKLYSKAPLLPGAPKKPDM